MSPLLNIERYKSSINLFASPFTIFHCHHNCHSSLYFNITSNVRNMWNHPMIYIIQEFLLYRVPHNYHWIVFSFFQCNVFRKDERGNWLSLPSGSAKILTLSLRGIRNKYQLFNLFFVLTYLFYRKIFFISFFLLNRFFTLSINLDRNTITQIYA